MRLAILSAGTGWHVGDLMRAAADLGISAAALDFRRVAAGVEFDDAWPGRFDAYLVRTMPPGSLEQVVFRMDVLHQLQARGMPVLNPPRAVETCVDKYLTTAKLSAAGLPTPPTFVCQAATEALRAFHRLGSDVVVKPLFGAEGKGMVRITDQETAWRIFHAVERTQGVLYLQQFVENAGFDLRLFVIGTRVAAGMRRTVQGGWRANVAQGAFAEAFVPNDSQVDLALRAARAVDAAVCGVDLLPARNETTYVLEVNAVPGWRALAHATGIDIAREVLDFLTHEYRSQGGQSCSDWPEGLNMNSAPPPSLPCDS